MALCYKAKLPFAFRERDVKAFFAATGALQQELQRERRLSGARLSLHQVQPLSVEATAQDVVQPGNASRKAPLTTFRMLLIHGQQGPLLGCPARQISTCRTVVATNNHSEPAAVPRGSAAATDFRSDPD